MSQWALHFLCHETSYNEDIDLFWMWSMRNILGNPKSFCLNHSAETISAFSVSEGVTARLPLHTPSQKKHGAISIHSVENTDWWRTGKALRIVFSPVPASDVCHLCFLVPDRGRKPWRVPHPRSVPVLPHAPGTDCPGCVSRWTSRRWRGCRSLSGWNESHTCLENRVNYPESQNINMSRTIDTNDKMLIRDSVHMRRLFI